jgi:hypothetical protein
MAGTAYNKFADRRISRNAGSRAALYKGVLVGRQTSDDGQITRLI